MLHLNPPPSQGQIPSYSDLLSAFKNAQAQVNSLASAGTTDTLSGAQIAGGIFVRSGASTAVAATTDTAANIIAALGPNAAAGETFLLFYVNLNTATGAVTVAAGTGVTLAGTNTIPIAGCRVYVGTVTSATTVLLNGVFSFGSGVAA